MRTELSSPIIKAIETGVPPKTWDEFSNPQVINNIKKLKEVWPTMAECLRKNVYYLSRPYCEAMTKSKEAFIKMFKNDENPQGLVKDITDRVSRCYIQATPVGVDYKHLYTMLVDNGEVMCFAQFADVFPVALLLYINDEKAASINFGLEDAAKNNIDVEKCDFINRGDTIGKCVSDMYIYLCMEKYAKVETRDVAPSCTCRPSLQHLDTIKNDTRLKIHVRDSTWFTTICRNEGFNVSGHFRLQPKKKDGEWTRELIYISPYQKTGYHRTAKVIKK